MPVRHWLWYCQFRSLPKLSSVHRLSTQTTCPNVVDLGSLPDLGLEPYHALYKDQRDTVLEVVVLGDDEENDGMESAVAPSPMRDMFLMPLNGDALAGFQGLARSRRGEKTVQPRPRGIFRSASSLHHSKITFKWLTTDEVNDGLPDKNFPESKNEARDKPSFQKVYNLFLQNNISDDVIRLRVLKYSSAGNLENGCTTCL
ncbi:hypothetical protein HAX54_028155 [Datura stramonium]|uniref:Uncharacterized protein n=1 Tax=Datura stramonium TaxID=4076 RepID=A0ABS8V4F9_DATST|nr:hypothetical protein [Datura stramonium]